MASNTGCSSPGELEMTRSTSDVAVCCSNDSESSRVRACSASNSRTFSIAITAWSAKVVTSSICLSVNGRTSERSTTMTPIGVPSRSSGTPSIVRQSPRLVDFAPVVFRIGQHVGDVNRLTLERDPADAAFSPGVHVSGVSIEFLDIRAKAMAGGSR